MSNLCVSGMWFFMFLDTSLSRTCFFGTMPARFSPWRSASWVDEDGVAVDFHHHHDIFIASLRSRMELARLVREHGFVYLVHFGVDITYFLAMELQGVTCF
jgi:hypothetical protein